MLNFEFTQETIAMTRIHVVLLFYIVVLFTCFTLSNHILMYEKFKNTSHNTNYYLVNKHNSGIPKSMKQQKIKTLDSGTFRSVYV